MRRLTNEEFLNKLYSLKGNDYTPLEEYVNAKTPIKVRCNKCGDVFETRAENLYNGGCLKCGYEMMKNKQRKTDKQFKKEVCDLVGDEYTFIDKYVNNTTKLKVKHNKCEHCYEVTPRDFLSGRRCPNCKGKRISKSSRLSHEEFMEKLNEVLEDDYVVLNEYKNAKTKLKVKHLKCGRVYEVSPYKLLNGNRCSHCVFKELGEKNSKKHTDFIKELTELYGEEYEVLSEYINNRTKIKVKHNKCGFIYEVTPDAMLRGNGCPRCKQSKGELKITRLLEEYKIKFKPQYKFSDCVYKDKLPYDFAILDNNDKIVALIEYQGEQHYKPIDFFGGKDSFKEQVEKDNIKRDYAKSKNIPLIEIPFYTKDIKGVLINNTRINKLIPR